MNKIENYRMRLVLFITSVFSCNMAFEFAQVKNIDGTIMMLIAFGMLSVLYTHDSIK